MKIYKYKIIYSEIINYILTNKWPVGSYMKSENELIKLFKVSRLTIRNVLSILENEGRIKRSRGKKTFILDKQLRNKLNTEIKDREITIKQDYSLVDFKLISNHLKNKFPSSKSLYFIERTMCFTKQPIYLISKAYISKEIVGNINKSIIIKNRSLVYLLMISFQINFKRSNQELKAINLSANDAKLFQTVKDMPAISNTWFFYDNNDNLVLTDEEITIKPLNVRNTYY